jgi:hypothetical protein
VAEFRTDHPEHVATELEFDGEQAPSDKLLQQ